VKSLNWRLVRLYLACIGFAVASVLRIMPMVYAGVSRDWAGVIVHCSIIILCFFYALWCANRIRILEGR
jgi:hypothetical protein